MFQDAVTATLIRAALSCAIDHYYWEVIYFQTASKVWKKFETNNKAVTVLFSPQNTEKLKQV